MIQPTILTIAGSDPSGGAGIQADLKTIEAHRCFGTSVITALTAQNTLGVQGVLEVEPKFVGKQLTCLVDDLPPRVIKTGMLASAPIIKNIISALSSRYAIPTRCLTAASASSNTLAAPLPPLPPLIIDPVSISTSRHSLLSTSAIKDLVFDLLPLSLLVTPNAIEAGMIVGCLRAGGRDGLSSGLSASESRILGSDNDALTEEALGRVIKDTEEDTGVTIVSIGDMIAVGLEILSFLHSRSSPSRPSTSSGAGEGRSRGEKGVLIKGGHVPLTRSEFKTQLERIRAGSDLDLNLELEVVWNGGTSEADLDEEAFVEILAASRQTIGSPAMRIDDSTTRGQPGGTRPTTLTSPSDQCIVDILLTSAGDGETIQATMFVAPSVDSTSTHGTGCTLSAAIASNVGLGKTLKEAVGQGIEYVQYALVTAESKGQGHGPLNHQCMSIARTLPLPTQVNPHPFMSYLLRSTPVEWKRYVRHPFIIQLGRGTLSIASFRHYIIQDWHYLRHYARAHALAASKTADFDEIKAFSEISLHIARESSMHVDFCKTFGVSMDELLASTESPANFSYSQYILDVGHRGDVLELVVAVLSCLVGYGEVGLYLQRKIASGSEGFVLEGNSYRRWIEDYSGKEYQDAVSRGIESLEKRIVKEQPSPARLERLVQIWKDCVRLETNFWQMGLDLS